MCGVQREEMCGVFSMLHPGSLGLGVFSLAIFAPWTKQLKSGERSKMKQAPVLFRC